MGCHLYLTNGIPLEGSAVINSRVFRTELDWLNHPATTPSHGSHTSVPERPKAGKSPTGYKRAQATSPRTQE